MAVLRSVSKCSRTYVYAPLLKRIAPCPRTKTKILTGFIFNLINNNNIYFLILYIIICIFFMREEERFSRRDFWTTCSDTQTSKARISLTIGRRNKRQIALRRGKCLEFFHLHELFAKFSRARKTRIIRARENFMFYSIVCEEWYMW